MAATTSAEALLNASKGAKAMALQRRIHALCNREGASVYWRAYECVHIFYSTFVRSLSIYRGGNCVVVGFLGYWQDCNRASRCVVGVSPGICPVASTILTSARASTSFSLAAVADVAR
jgi:hypothetical protein